MDLLQLFKDHLFSNGATPLTIKNYCSDLRKFIGWFESNYSQKFNPTSINSQSITLFSSQMREKASHRSVERYLSSLRKFFAYLEKEKHIPSSPFYSLENKKNGIKEDPWKLANYKNFLYENNASSLTIKNYLADVRAFQNWAQKSLVSHDYVIKDNGLADNFSFESLDEYKRRLLNISHLKPTSVNRKLSSIRKYIEFAHKEKLIVTPPNIKENPVITQDVSLQDIASSRHDSGFDSSLPPVRLAKRLVFPIIFVQEKLANLTAGFIVKYKLNTLSSSIPTLASQRVGNVSKSFYAPHLISTDNFPTHKKIVQAIRTNRPKWYKQYHQYPIVHYIHFGILVLFAAGIGYSLFQGIFPKADTSGKILGARSYAGKILSFKGSLKDATDNPVTEPVDLRFGIYSSSTASGSALLWEELQPQVDPDESGEFSVMLGSNNDLSESLFSQSANLYLGIAIGNTPELLPRKALAAVGSATNSEQLLGMSPITESGSGTSNVILALNSAGNLTIGGKANPNFQATGGQFRLAGTTLLLATITGTSGNVIISPDGFGVVDIQKSIVNTSSNGGISGAVEIADTVYVNATESSSAAFIVNNNNALGDIFAASRSGVPQFVINKDGFVGVNTTTPEYNVDINGTFRVSGKTTLNNVSYLWPESEGLAGHILSTNGDGTLSWTPASSLLSEFTQSNGVLYTNSSTVDFIVGGRDRNSNQFWVLNINSGTPSASISAGTNGASYITANGIFATTSNQPLTFGSTTTGQVRLSPQGLTALVALPNGNIGVGTVNPVFKFELSDSQAATVASFMTNTSTSNDADVLALKVGAVSVGPSNRFITFMNGNGVTVGSIQGNGSDGVSYATTGVDVAEYYIKQDPEEIMTAGDIVCLGSLGGVTRCNASSSKAVGVVSDKPGFVGGSEHMNDPTYVIVGILGQLDVPVSSSSSISASDALTVSEFGQPVKAEGPGFILGHALESYDPSTGKTKIRVAINPSWYDPEVFMSKKGGLVFENKTGILSDENQPASDTLAAKTYFVSDSSGNIIEKIGLFSEIVVGVIDAGSIKAKEIAAESFKSTFASVHELTTESLNVTSELVKIDGQSLKDYIVQTVGEISSAAWMDQISNLQIESPIASIPFLKTQIISPLGEDVAFYAEFDNNRFSFKNTRGMVAQIDASGSARFAGTVSASGLEGLSASISGNLDANSLTATSASISGTLYADSIATSNIDGLDEKIYISTQSILSSSTSEVLDTIRKQINENYVDISTMSARFALITDGIISLGTTTMREATIYDQLRIGSNFTLSDNSINVIGEDLHIQPLGQGGVSFIAGLVTIDTVGNLRVSGNAYFAKNLEVGGILSASILSPLAHSDFVVRLRQDAPEDDVYPAKPSEFVIQNASGSSVLRVSSDGALSASGSGTFAKLNLNLISQAIALSDTESIATGSAGGAVIKSQKNEVTIKNQLVTESSLIYITPSGNTEGSVLYLMRQLSGESFTVGINDIKDIDIPFNWIIVN